MNNSGTDGDFPSDAVTLEDLATILQWATTQQTPRRAAYAALAWGVLPYLRGIFPVDLTNPIEALTLALADAEAGRMPDMFKVETGGGNGPVPKYPEQAVRCYASAFMDLMMKPGKGDGLKKDAAAREVKSLLEKAGCCRVDAVTVANWRNRYTIKESNEGLAETYRSIIARNRANGVTLAQVKDHAAQTFGDLPKI